MLFAPSAPPRLLAVVDWEMASIGDPLVDLAWALIFHPGSAATDAARDGAVPTFDLDRIPPADATGRPLRANARVATCPAIDWYDVFARWKLAIVLEGSYAKWQRGESTSPCTNTSAPRPTASSSATELVEERSPSALRVR